MTIHERCAVQIKQCTWWNSFLGYVIPSVRLRYRTKVICV